MTPEPAGAPCIRHVPGFGQCGLPATDHQLGQLNHPYQRNETTGWWVISGENLLDLLRRAHAGENPDTIFAEEWANGNHEAVPGE